MLSSHSPGPHLSCSLFAAYPADPSKHGRGIAACGGSALSLLLTALPPVPGAQPSPAISLLSGVNGEAWVTATPTRAPLPSLAAVSLRTYTLLFSSLAHRVECKGCECETRSLCASSARGGGSSPLEAPPLFYAGERVFDVL